MMRLATNLIVFAWVWMLITEASADAWIIGGPVVAAAAWTAIRLAPGGRWRWSLAGFLRFVPHFARCSFLAGLDVAWRSLHPRLPIHPRLLEFDLRLPNGTARIFFMNVVNLLPGTVSADVCDDVLIVHVLDGTQPTRKLLTRLEQVVAELFSISLGDRQEVV